MTNNPFLAGAIMSAAAASMLMAPPMRRREVDVFNLTPDDREELGWLRPMRDITPKAGHMTRQRAADPAKKAARKRQAAARAKTRRR